MKRATASTFRHDGDQILAEYSATGSLLCKHIYGPGVDQPICALRRVDTVVEYYHFDGLGSVVALSDLWLSYEDGDTIETYEYTVYGEVAAEDANHPNRFLFTGREFDKETGLYYYRARYYNPALGRFLQTDPAGCGYGYCSNDPLGRIDPSGCADYAVSFGFPVDCIASPLLANFLAGQSPVEFLRYVQQWFADLGLFDPAGEKTRTGSAKYSDWTIQEATLTGCFVNMTLRNVSWDTLMDTPRPQAPSLRYTYARITVDATPVMKQTVDGKNYFGMKNPTWVDSVPYILVDRVGLLDDRLLNRMIMPAIQEINGWWRANANVENHMKGDWDTWFYWHTPELFRWSNWMEYGGGEVNYIAGGHAFAHFAFRPEMMKHLVWVHKTTNYPNEHYVWEDPRLDATYFWCNKGYNEYDLRRGW